MYINTKKGVLKITFAEITFKTCEEINTIKQARRSSESWTPCKHLF